MAKLWMMLSGRWPSRPPGPALELEQILAPSLIPCRVCCLRFVQITALFEMFDPTGRGGISPDQYRQALASLGIDKPVRGIVSRAASTVSALRPPRVFHLTSWHLLGTNREPRNCFHASQPTSMVLKPMFLVNMKAEVKALSMT